MSSVEGEAAAAHGAASSLETRPQLRTLLGMRAEASAEPSYAAIAVARGLAACSLSTVSDASTSRSMTS